MLVCGTAQLNQKLKMAKTKERIKAKAQDNALKRQMEQLPTPVQQEQKQKIVTDEDLLKIFGSSEKAEKSMRGDKPQPTANKKKKGKK
jgi:hypothetical protein